MIRSGSEQQVKRLRSALAEMRSIREELKEIKFRDLLKDSLKADEDTVKDLSEVIRRFDEESGEFENPYERMMEIIGGDRERRELFFNLVHGFRPKAKGLKGGLQGFGKELKEERKRLAQFLKAYMKMHSRRHRLSDSRKNELLRIEHSIPSKITKEMKIQRRPPYKALATEWMTRYYPCTEKTLVQITRQQSAKRSPHRRRTKRRSRKLNKK